MNWENYLTAAARSSLRNVEFRPKGAVEGSLQGTRRSPRHGFAVEFAGHREYVPGDDGRYIDWRTFYRSGRLYTKQYQEETNLHVYLLLDASRSMRYPTADHPGGGAAPSKREFAARLAMALAYVAVRKRDAVSLVPFPPKDPRNQEPRIPRPASTWVALDRIAAELDDLPDPAQPVPIGEALAQLARHVARGRMGRRGMIIVISDFLDERDQDLDVLKSTLRKLQCLRHELLLYHVLHPDEYDLESLARRLKGPCRFHDLERASTKDAPTDGGVWEAYRNAVFSYLERMESICRTLAVKYVFTTTDRQAGEIVRESLNSKRQILSHLRLAAS